MGSAVTIQWKCHLSVLVYEMRVMLVAIVAIVAVAAAGACTPFKNAGVASRSDDKEADAGPLADAEAGDERDADTTNDGKMATGGAGSAGTAGRAPAMSGSAAGRNAAAAGSGGSDAAGSGGSAGQAGSGTLEDEGPPLSMEPLAPDVRFVAPETADVESLDLLSNWSRLPVLGTGRYEQRSSRDRNPNGGAASSVYTVADYGNRDYDFFICRSENADIDPNQLTAPYFDMPVCSESYVRGAVIARFEGSGQMHRFWITWTELTLDSPGPEVLRVYVDDNPAAAIQVPLSLVLNGMAGETFTIPFGAVSTSYVAWHYPIVFSRKLVVALDHLSSDYYYQVDAVLDEQPRRRVAARRRLDQRDAAHALLVRDSPVPSEASSLHAERIDLAAGQERTVQLSGPATIEEFRVRVPVSAFSSLGDVRIAVRWDDAARLAIDLPLLDLFGSSRTTLASNSLALAASVDGDVQTLSLRLPMPYRAGAEWKLTNGGQAPVGFELDWIGRTKVPDAAFGQLNVQLNDAGSAPAQLDQTVAEVSGRGRFVGVCADLGGHHDTKVIGAPTSGLDLLQGDFRMMADDRFVIHSPGTEDYANSAFYFLDSPKSSPFAQSWGRVDDASANPPGQISFCRWQVLGAEIDFQRSFQAIHEVAQYDTAIVSKHRMVAFLYLE